MDPIPATVTSSHDPSPPALPPLPEAILFNIEAGDKRWCATWGTLARLEPLQAEMSERAGWATRLVTLTPPSARDASDAEVAEILRSVLGGAGGGTDERVLSQWPIAAACVRAALTNGNAHAK